MNKDGAHSKVAALQTDQGPSESRPATALGVLEHSVAWALNKRVMIMLMTLMFSAAGLWAFLAMRVDAVPDISNIQVTVTTTARGLAPTEVEQYITYPIEMALQSMPRLKLQRSISKYSLSQVTAVFEDGTDIYWARQQVNERLKTAQEQMPAVADIKMALGPIATGLGEVFQFEVKGPGYSLMQLRDILDWQITPALKTIAGIDEVQSMGGEAKEYQVWLEPERLHGYKVTPAEVCTALTRTNSNAGGGYVVEQSDQILLRAEGMLTGVRDIGAVVVRRGPQSVLRVRDLGRVVVGKRLQQSIVTSAGQGETVIGVVIMRKGENSKELVERIKEKLAIIGRGLPANVAIRPFYDRGVLIDRTIDTVKDNLLHGAVLVLVVLLVLLGSLRGGLIAALAIPMALAGSLLFLSISSISGNLLSLGAIDFGILIDGSVVMVENILRRLSHRSNESRLEIIKAAAIEVAAPVLAAVLIITAVYLPILGLPGVSGKTFQPMALTVVFGLITALFVALYITPAMCHFLLERTVQEKDSYVMRLIRNPYRRLLFLVVKMPWRTAGVALALFVASLLLVPFLGSEFIPVLREGSLVLTVNRPVSGSLLTAAEQTTLIERLILENQCVEKVVSRTGHSEIAFDPMGPDETDVFIILKPPALWKNGTTQEAIEGQIESKLKENLPGLIFSLSQPIEQRMNELVAGAKSDVAIRVYGADLDKLRSVGQEIAGVVSKVRGCADVKLEQTAGLPAVTAKLNQTALASYGVFAQEALNTVAAAVDGRVVGTIYEGRPRYPLSVRFQPESVRSAQDIGELPVATAAGELVPLNQIAAVSYGLSSAQIAHMQGERTFMVQLNVRNRDLGGFVEEARLAVDRQVILPTGYHIEWGGQFENMKVAQERLFLLVPLSLLLIFALLFGLYNDWRPGGLIFANIPLAFSGGIVALFCRHMALSVTAGVGFIALFGVAVLNGVVLVSTIRQLELTRLMNPRQAAVVGAQQRLRPVLMTALVASLGFLPMAVATSVGAEVQRPLATVVIAGLFSATLLTLLVLPSLYALICGRPGRKITAGKNELRQATAKKKQSQQAVKLFLLLVLGGCWYQQSAWGATVKSKTLSAQNSVTAPNAALEKNGASLSLDAALNEALLLSPRAAALRLQLGIAKSNLARATQMPNPSIFMDNGYRAEYTYRYGASLPVEFPWKVALRIISAKKSISIADLEINKALWAFRCEVRRAYTEVVVAQERQNMFSQLCDLYGRLLDSAERRFKAGDVAQVDVLRSELAHLQADILRRQSETEVLRSRQNVAVILGRTYQDMPRVPQLFVQGAGPGGAESAPSSILARADFLPGDKPLPSLESALQMARSNRLELKLNAQLLAQARTNLKLAVANITPNPVIGAGSSVVNGPALPLDASPFANNIYHGFFFQTAVELPILNHQQGDISRYRAEIVQLGAQETAQRNVIEGEVVQAYQNLLIQERKIASYRQQALAKSIEIVRMTQRGYEVGQSDITSVLLAQQANVQVRSDFLDTIRAYQLAYTELEQVVGGTI